MARGAPTADVRGRTLRTPDAAALKERRDRVDLDLVRSPTSLGALIGSSVGGALPGLWGAGFLSLAGFMLSIVGGIAGVLVAARYADGI